MTPEKMTGSSISIVIKTYFGILDMLPELLKMLTEYKTSSYFLEHLLEEVEYSQNVSVIAAEDIAVRPLEIKLQEKNIPFQMVPSQDFSEFIKSSGRYLFLIRESDFGKALEAAEEVKKALSPEIESENLRPESEEEPELVRGDCGLSESENGEKTEEEREEILQPDEEEPLETADMKGKSNVKAEKNSEYRSADSRLKLSRMPDPSSRSDYEEAPVSEQRRNSPRPFAGTRDTHAQEFHHAAEKKEAAQTTLNKSADFHNGRVDTSSPKIEHEVPGRNRFGQEKQNQHEPMSVSKRKGVAGRPDATRHLPGQEKASLTFHQSGSAVEGSISILGNGLDIQPMQAEKKEEKTKSRMGGAAAPDSLQTFSAKRFRQGQGGSAEPSAIRPSKDLLKACHFQDGVLSADKTAAKPNRYFITKMARGQAVSPLNVTNQILKERRKHSARDVLASRYFTGTLFIAKHSVSQSVLDRDTEAGRVFNNIEDFISPIGRYAKSKYLAHGAIALNKEIDCSAQVFLAAYAAKHGCDIGIAQQTLMKVNGIKELFDSSNGKSIHLQDLEELRNSLGAQGFIGIFNGLTDQGMANFIQNADISDGLKRALLGYSKKALNDPNLLSKLLGQFTGRKDQECLQMMYGSIISRHIGPGLSLSSLFRGNLIQILKRVSRNSDAGRAAASLYYSGKSIYGAYRAGIRLLMTILDRTQICGLSIHTKLVLSNPGKALKKHTFQVAKRTAGNAVRKAAVTRLGRNVRMISRGFSHTLMRTRFINHTIGSLKTLNMLRQGIHTAIMNTRIMVKVTQFGKVAAQLAAKAGAALGWIAAVVIIVILILEIGQGLVNSKVEDGGAVNHIYVQDTEIIQEVIDELSAKNEAFIIDINHAANHRGNYAVNSGFKADEGVSFYEDGAYHVIFRDFYGNELEPSHVDLNNTKAIISMATKFMPYPFTKLSDQVSEEEKKAYEEIKQHFKDYCNYLWASTHQISIEEYHPGDSNYSHVDASALITELSTGICGKDGERLWLPDDFRPNVVSGSSCGQCQEAETTGLGPFNDNLCSHGNDKNPHGGWVKTGNTVQHINCPNGHEHHDDDSSWTEYCEIGYVQNRNHIHTCYEWVYECGGHMGSVVYVTVGDLSRIPDFGPAGDVDYGAVGVYNTENTDNSAEESTASEEDA